MVLYKLSIPCTCCSLYKLRKNFSIKRKINWFNNLHHLPFHSTTLQVSTSSNAYPKDKTDNKSAVDTAERKLTIIESKLSIKLYITRSTKYNHFIIVYSMGGRSLYSLS